MKTRFRYSMSGPGLRPLLDFRVVGLPPEKTFLGLVDSGSNPTYLDARIADELGISSRLTNPGETWLGANKFVTREGSIELVVGQYRWESTVRFAENWNLWHMILGLHDLFELFKVDVDAETLITELTPKPDHPRLTRVPG